MGAPMYFVALVPSGSNQEGRQGEVLCFLWLDHL